MHSEQPILLVEDEGPLRTILGRNLERRGYRGVAVATGATALAALRVGTPALLQLDVNLADMTGWDVLHAVPVNSRQRIPAIMVSAVMQHPKRHQEFGEVAFLQKPFPLEALQRRAADKLAGERQDEVVEAWS